MLENILMIIIGFLIMWTCSLPVKGSSIVPKILFGVFLIVMGIIGIIN